MGQTPEATRADAQRGLKPFINRLLVQAFNVYYAVLHFPVLIGCMIWLFVRHQASWRSRPSAG